MPRPRKNPDDPKWQEQPKRSDAWEMYFAAAMTGLIVKGGTSMESLVKTAAMYADEAVKAMGEA